MTRRSAARSYGGESEEEKLEPMPPPPAPRAHPVGPGMPHTGREQHQEDEDDELLTPEAAPVPHTHPLTALADERSRDAQVQQTAFAGGMAMRSHSVLGKRLDPAFLSRARVSALAKRKDPIDGRADQGAGAFAVETQHSSRALALALQQQIAAAEQRAPPPPLTDQERSAAATEASAQRHALFQSVRQAGGAARWSQEDDENDGSAGNGALARASERKVAKQLDAKWLRTRQDASNRPLTALERADELSMRETLFRTSASELLRSRLLYDEADAARDAAFVPLSRPPMPLVTSGYVGLAGCCFDNH